MDATSEDEKPDTGVTTGHGTFVVDTGDVRGHRSVSKQNIFTGKVAEDQLMGRIDTYGLVTPTKTNNAVWCYFRKYDSKKIKENTLEV